jgi:hypothetical protein
MEQQRQYTVLENTYEYSKKYADENGLDLVGIEDPNLVVLDIDSEAARWVFERRLQFMQEQGLDVIAKEMKPSKTPGHWHVHLRLSTSSLASEAGAIALAAILGSDWRREACALLGLWKGDKVPRRLFESPSEETTRMTQKDYD